jgi:SPP1 family holin
MKVSADTIARTIILALALINQVLSTTGHAVLPISDEQVEQIVSLIFTIVASVAAWWKNNSFTVAAITGDKVLKALKHKSADSTEDTTEG